MKTALIWYTWFVWSNILKQNSFTDLYNSKNISDIKWKEYDLIVCAWVKAVKWWANKNPEEDLEWIDNLIKNIKEVKTKKIVLISTVDVYPNPINIDEDFNFSSLNKDNHHAYWLNRLYLENFIKNTFTKFNIIRLPWLFWNNLSKNVIFDLLNNKLLENIIPNIEVQYYYLDNIWKDINIAIENHIEILNINSEPIKTGEIIERFFPEKKELIWRDVKNPIIYNYKSKNYKLFWWTNWYLYSKKQFFEQLKNFIYNYKK